jgi:hypothetical protein
LFRSRAPKHPLDFIEEIIEQGLGILKFIAPSYVAFRAMPVVACLRPLLEPSADGSNSMGVVEADQSRAVGRMERERIGQSVRPILTRLNLLDLEPYPVIFFEMMDVSIEGEQELERMVRSAIHIL